MNNISAPNAPSMTLYQDVIDGLSKRHRTLPCKYLYDQKGSKLFDEITRLDEYYPTRAEIEILNENHKAISDSIGPDAAIIELGSGSSEKTRLLLDTVNKPAAYVPIDISSEYLEEVTAQLALEYPQIDILPLAADFTRSLDVDWNLRLPSHERRVAFFPGSTIGNFTPSMACELLRNVRCWVGEHGGLLIGVDLQKDTDVLHRAYDDSQGVTAAFNLNLLTRINREAGTDFDESQFAHRVKYNTDFHRMELFLESLTAQTVSCGQHQFHFKAGELICTEYSHKYTVEGFCDLAADCRFELSDVWLDRQGYFGVFAFEVV